MKSDQFTTWQYDAWKNLREKCKSAQGRISAWHRAYDFLQLVDKHFYDQRALSFYVKELHTSKSTLREACAKVLKQSPRSCIECRLVHEAVLMIRSGRLCFTAISFELGFEDHSHFVRVFKKHTGMTPSDFRKQP
jgi:AraC family transcriptional regulator, transcriptional activator of pobA